MLAIQKPDVISKNRVDSIWGHSYSDARLNFCAGGILSPAFSCHSKFGEKVWRGCFQEGLAMSMTELATKGGAI